MKNKFIVFVFFFFLSIISIKAETLDLESDKYILYNLNDNVVLTEKNANVETQVASLTKIMTTIVAIENIKDFNEKVTITDEMINDIEWDVSVAGFKVGDTVTYNDLLYGSILPSGADAANALAYSVRGGYKEFINLMNKKVKELKLSHTHFTNVVGLYDKNNYSSAYDMAQILEYSLKNEKFKEVFTTKKYTSTNNIEMKSTLIGYSLITNESNITSITGAKTGYIQKAGYCLASTSSINNVNYLLITLNGYEKGSHLRDAVKTYNYYGKNYAYHDIVKKDTIITNIKTINSKEKSIDVLANINLKHYMNNNFDFNKIQYEYSGVKTLSYFTKKGTVLGTVKVFYDNQELDKFDLVYSQDLTFSLVNFIKTNKVGIIMIITMLYITYRLIKKKIEKSKKK